MDSVRENRVRRMVPDPSIWPHRTHLCMKRYQDNRLVEWGNLMWLPSGRIAITSDQPEALHIFLDVDALIAAGWAVD